MKIFLVSQGQDTGGQAQRTAAAFRKHTDWQVHAMCAGETYIKFPVDEPWDYRRARAFYRNADVVHHMNWLYGYAMYDRDQRKPAVVHHHGPPLRDHADEVNNEARSIGAVQIVATVDLLEQAPHAEWVPGFYDLDWIRQTFPRIRGDDGKLRIGHGPTVRAAKGTEQILKALDAVSKRVTNIEVELIEGVTWHESLRRKAQCDVWIDQITLGYGGSAIEAMAMGIPTISGWENGLYRKLFKVQTGRVSKLEPFMHAHANNIDDKLLSMVEAPELRQYYACDGRQFVAEYHAERRGVEQLQRIYASAKPTRGIDALELWNGRDVKDAALAKYGGNRR